MEVNRNSPDGGMIESGRLSSLSSVRMAAIKTIADQAAPYFLLVENAATGIAASMNMAGLLSPPVYQDNTRMTRKVMIMINR